MHSCTAVTVAVARVFFFGALTRPALMHASDFHSDFHRAMRHLGILLIDQLPWPFCLTTWPDSWSPPHEPVQTQTLGQTPCTLAHSTDLVLPALIRVADFKAGNYLFTLEGPSKSQAALYWSIRSCLQALSTWLLIQAAPHVVP